MKDPNERRALIAIVLCLAVYFVWSALFAPKPQPTPEGGEAPVAGAPPSGEQPAGTPPAAPTPAPAAVAEAPCTDQVTPLSSSSVDLAISTCGGGTHELELPHWQDAVTVTPWWKWLTHAVTTFSSPGPWVPYAGGDTTEQLLTKEGQLAFAGAGDFTERAAFQVSGGDGKVVATRTTDGLTVTQTFAPGDAPDVFSVKVTFSSDRPIDGPFWVGVADAFPDIKDAYDSHGHLAGAVEGKMQKLDKPSGLKGPQPFEGAVNWFGVADRYFLAALAPSDPAWGTLRWVPMTDGRTGGFLVSNTASITPGQPLSVDLMLYAGPKEVERLHALGHSLDAAVDLGFFGFFSKILLFFLHIFHAVVKNWGLSIIALTFFVRLSFYPLSARAFRSAKLMQAVQPKIKALQEKYADDKEALTREQMALFQKHGVNPVGGCLPMLFQMPVFFALYRALLNTPDLYHAYFLHVRDLSAPDPFGAFPFFMAVGMVLQQRMTPMTGVDPGQAQMMRFMPLVFALFMFGLPAGLSLYYALNTLLSIAQQWYNTHSFKPIELAED